jgi:hypothetical protein
MSLAFGRNLELHIEQTLFKVSGIHRIRNHLCRLFLSHFDVPENQEQKNGRLDKKLNGPIIYFSYKLMATVLLSDSFHVAIEADCDDDALYAWSSKSSWMDGF